ARAQRRQAERLGSRRAARARIGCHAGRDLDTIAEFTTDADVIEIGIQYVGLVAQDALSGNHAGEHAGDVQRLPSGLCLYTPIELTGRLLCSRRRGLELLVLYANGIVVPAEHGLDGIGEGDRGRRFGAGYV